MDTPAVDWKVAASTSTISSPLVPAGSVTTAVHTVPEARLKLESVPAVNESLLPLAKDAFQPGQHSYAWDGLCSEGAMAGTYVHLSGRDIDNAILQANDVEVKTERTAPMLKIKTCPKCRFDNGIDSTYCARCGAELEIYTTVKKNEERENITSMFAEAMKDPETAEKIGRIIKGRKKKG